MAVSKKTRFEIFKRDGFACQYCGRKPPEITLEVDHVVAKSQGGTDEEENLLTSCFDCNRGKSNKGLGSALLEKRDSKAEQEKLEQLKEFEKFLIEKKDYEDRRVLQCWDYFEEETNLGIGKEECASIRRFLKDLDLTEVMEAVDIVVSKGFADPNKVFSYFCGICHNKIRAKRG